MRARAMEGKKRERERILTAAESRRIRIAYYRCARTHGPAPRDRCVVVLRTYLHVYLARKAVPP